MERLEELRTALGRSQIWYGLTVHLQSILMIILIGAPRDGQAVVLILNKPPDQGVERAQRVELQVRQRIMIRRPALVLEAEGDGVHGLYQHSLFLPERPAQFEHGRT